MGMHKPQAFQALSSVARDWPVRHSLWLSRDGLLHCDDVGSTYAFVFNRTKTRHGVACLAPTKTAVAIVVIRAGRPPPVRELIGKSWRLLDRNRSTLVFDDSVCIGGVVSCTVELTTRNSS